MDKRQILRECAENLTLLTQLGLSLAAPPVLSLLAAAWLIRRYALGYWVMVAALLLGIAGGIWSARCFWSQMQRRLEQRASADVASAERQGGEQHEN